VDGFCLNGLTDNAFNDWLFRSGSYGGVSNLDADSRLVLQVLGRKLMSKKRKRIDEPLEPSSFHFTNLRPGLPINMSTRTTMGWMIRFVFRKAWKELTGKPMRECPNHDAGVVKFKGKLWIGESVAPVAKLTSIEEYERMINSGHVYRIRVLEVAGATRTQERKAAQEWMDNVLGTKYDWMACPRLLFKALVGDWIKTAAGRIFEFWCTEGWQNSYEKHTSLRPWHKLNSTPFTTYKRTMEGFFNIVWQGER